MPRSPEPTTLEFVKYQPVKPLGAGGMGQVFEGIIHFPLDQARPCAIKSIRSDRVSMEAVALFTREAMIGWDLTGHPNIVNTRSFGQWPDGSLFLVLDHEGPALPDVFDDLYGQYERIRTIARHMLHALVHLKHKGIVHGDISLANILLSPDGNAKLSDFGLARYAADAERAEKQSLAATLVGVPAYAAPEVLRGARPTHASDLYSLGAVLFELLSNERPYGSGPFLAVLTRVNQGPPASLPGSIPADLAKLVRGLIQERPEDRLTAEQGLAIMGRGGHELGTGNEDIAAIARAAIAEQTGPAEQTADDGRVDTQPCLLGAAGRHLRGLEARDHQRIEQPQLGHHHQRIEQPQLGHHPDIEQRLLAEHLRLAERRQHVEHRRQSAKRPSVSRATWQLAAALAALIAIPIAYYALRPEPETRQPIHTAATTTLDSQPVSASAALDSPPAPASATLDSQPVPASSALPTNSIASPSPAATAPQPPGSASIAGKRQKTHATLTRSTARTPRRTSARREEWQGVTSTW